MIANTALNLDDFEEVIIEEDGTPVLVLPRSERFMRNRLNYEVEIKDDTANWLSTVNLPDDNGSIQQFHTNNLFTENDEINQIIDSFIKWCIRSYMPKTMSSVQKALEIFVSNYKVQKNIAKALDDAYTKLAQIRDLQPISPLRRLIQFLITYEAPDFDIDTALELLSIEVGGNQNQFQRLYTMDAEMGPFTREELRFIDECILNDSAPLDSRIIMALCREFGLRPIQISLLKQSDFQRNPKTGVAWLNVPKVKQRTQWRRSEFSKRILPDDEVADMLEEMIEENKWIVDIFDQESPPLFQRRFNQSRVFSNNFKATRRDAYNPYEDIFVGDKKDFAFHLSTTSINWRLSQLSFYMPLSPRTADRFQLNPYRFRYTVGTNAVLQGRSEPEVAMLLDHSNLGSVRHYFKNTREFWELIEKSTSSRAEQKHFAVAFMTREPEEQNMYVKDVAEKINFTTIGKCHKGAPCAYEVAVSCYSCQEFRPNNDIEAHNSAKIYIKEQIDWLKNNSSDGHITRQYDEAMAGCAASISLAQGGDVVGIYDSEASPFGLENTFGQSKLEILNDE